MSSKHKSSSKKNKRSSSKEPSRELSRDPTENTDNVNSKSKYYPIIIKLSPPKDSILDHDSDIVFSSNIDYPRSDYGFHHFIHANKNKTETLKQFEGRKKVYLVFNRFERYVDNYEESIGTTSKNYFSLGGDKPDILSRGFYKLWEILLMFDLIDVSKEKFVSAHLAEGPGSFIQATMFYRDTFCKKGLSKNDKFYAVTLHPEDVGGKEHVPELEKKFVEYYKTEKPQRFILHQTYTKQVAGGSKDKDNGDITDPKTIKLFGGQMDEKADLITGDGGFDWINENVQEQEAFKLIIAQIVAAFKLQKKGGSFVCKFFETFTKVSVKLVSILTQLYDSVHLVKPLMSRQSNSEKYAVCMGFKYSDKDKEHKTISKKLDTILEESHKNKQNISDLFTSYSVPRPFINEMVEINRLISNEQLKSINEIIAFVKKEIHAGDEYHDRREQQIEGSRYWIDLFLPKSEEVDKKKKIYSDMIKTVCDNSQKGATNLDKSLVYVNNQ